MRPKLSKWLTPWVTTLASPNATMTLTVPRSPLSSRMRHMLKYVRGRSNYLDAASSYLRYTDFDYDAQECHVNVLHRVTQQGGQRVNGWIIWESQPFDEAEFHCVWQHPDGTLIDVTPRNDHEEFILFLPDPKAKLSLGPNQGLVQPCNRTTNSLFPYAFQGEPQSNPTVENELHDSVHAYMDRFGITIHDLVK